MIKIGDIINEYMMNKDYSDEVTSRIQALPADHVKPDLGKVNRDKDYERNLKEISQVGPNQNNGVEVDKSVSSISPQVNKIDVREVYENIATDLNKEVKIDSEPTPIKTDVNKEFIELEGVTPVATSTRVENPTNDVNQVATSDKIEKVANKVDSVATSSKVDKVQDTVDNIASSERIEAVKNTVDQVATSNKIDKVQEKVDTIASSSKMETPTEKVDTIASSSKMETPTEKVDTIASSSKMETPTEKVDTIASSSKMETPTEKVDTIASNLNQDVVNETVDSIASNLNNEVIEEKDSESIATDFNGVSVAQDYLDLVKSNEGSESAREDVDSVKSNLNFDKLEETLDLVKSDQGSDKVESEVDLVKSNQNNDKLPESFDLVKENSNKTKFVETLDKVKANQGSEEVQDNIDQVKTGSVEDEDTSKYYIKRKINQNTEINESKNSNVIPEVTVSDENYVLPVAGNEGSEEADMESVDTVASDDCMVGLLGTPLDFVYPVGTSEPPQLSLKDQVKGVMDRVDDAYQLARDIGNSSGLYKMPEYSFGVDPVAPNMAWVSDQVGGFIKKLTGLETDFSGGLTADNLLSNALAIGGQLIGGLLGKYSNLNATAQARVQQEELLNRVYQFAGAKVGFDSDRSIKAIIQDKDVHSYPFGALKSINNLNLLTSNSATFTLYDNSKWFIKLIPLGPYAPTTPYYNYYGGTCFIPATDFSLDLVDCDQDQINTDEDTLITVPSKLKYNFTLNFSVINDMNDTITDYLRAYRNNIYGENVLKSGEKELKYQYVKTSTDPGTPEDTHGLWELTTMDNNYNYKSWANEVKDYVFQAEGDRLDRQSDSLMNRAQEINNRDPAKQGADAAYDTRFGTSSNNYSDGNVMSNEEYANLQQKNTEYYKDKKESDQKQLDRDKEAHAERISNYRDKKDNYQFSNMYTFIISPSGKVEEESAFNAAKGESTVFGAEYPSEADGTKKIIYRRSQVMTSVTKTSTEKVTKTDKNTGVTYKATQTTSTTTEVPDTSMSGINKYYYSKEEWVFRDIKTGQKQTETETKELCLLKINDKYKSTTRHIPPYHACVSLIEIYLFDQTGRPLDTPYNNYELAKQKKKGQEFDGSSDYDPNMRYPIQYGASAYRLKRGEDQKDPEKDDPWSRINYFGLVGIPKFINEHIDGVNKGGTSKSISQISFDVLGLFPNPLSANDIAELTKVIPSSTSESTTHQSGVDENGNNVTTTYFDKPSPLDDEVSPEVNEILENNEKKKAEAEAQNLEPQLDCNSKEAMGMDENEVGFELTGD